MPGCFGERDAIAIIVDNPFANAGLAGTKTKRPRVVNPRAFAVPREVGVTDLREQRSVLVDEVLATAFVTRQAARRRTVAGWPQCSRVGDVEKELHGNVRT